MRGMLRHKTPLHAPLPARNTCWNPWFYAVLALLCIYAAAVQWRSYIVMDNGWLLVAAERWLRGERLYVDILESNPPLIIWLYALPVRVAQLCSWPVIPTFTLAILLAVMATLALTIASVKRALPAWEVQIITLAIALALLGCSSFIWGQREHLWCLCIAPYLVQSYLDNPRALPRWQRLAAGCCAAIGFAIKPFFVVVCVANELTRAFERRQQNRFFETVFRAENICIAALGGAYCASVYFFTPEYFSTILPALQATYSGYHTHWAPLFWATFSLGVVYLVSALPALWRGDRRARRALIVWLAACSVHLLQQKGWYNHYYPMVFFGNILAAWGIIYILKPLVEAPFAARSPLSLPAFSVLCFACVAVLFVSVSEPIRTWDGRGANPFVERMRSIIAQYGKGENAAGLSFNLEANFPLMNYADAAYPMRFHQLWWLPGAVAHDDITQGDPTRAFWRERTRQIVREDMQRFLPRVVWVDRNAALTGALVRWDILAFLQDDPVFAGVWKEYTWLETITVPAQKPGMAATEYDIFVRRNKTP